MAKKILLTGASGFIGRNILEQLGGSFEFSAPSRLELDLADAQAVERYLKSGGFDAIIHAANTGGTRKTAGMAGVLETNLACFRNIARCSSHFGKLIQLGSGAEYGKGRPLVRVREGEFGKMVPQDEYGRYKYECSKIIDGGKNMVCLRIFGCFGKYEDYSSRFISNAICRSLFGLPVTIANRNVVFSYLYVDDFVRIVEHFISHDGAHKAYNVVPDETADILSIAQKVNAISKSDLPIVVKNPGMGDEYTGGNSRLREEMPGFQFTSLDKGMQALYSWYAANKEKIEYEKIASDRY